MLYHLNTINSLHSRLKEMLKGFNGVSIKYLNRYLAMFVALEQAGHSLLHPAVDCENHALEGKFHAANPLTPQ